MPRSLRRADWRWEAHLCAAAAAAAHTAAKTKRGTRTRKEGSGRESWVGSWTRRRTGGTLPCPRRRRGRQCHRHGLPSSRPRSCALPIPEAAERWRGARATRGPVASCCPPISLSKHSSPTSPVLFFVDRLPSTRSSSARCAAPRLRGSRRCLSVHTRVTSSTRRGSVAPRELLQHPRLHEVTLQPSLLVQVTPHHRRSHLP